MKIKARGILTLSIVAIALAGRGVAQTTQADIAARLVGKPLLLRGFWADDKLRFHADGSPAGSYRAGPFTLSAIDVTSVNLNSSGLTLEGQRVGINFGEDGSVTRIPLLRGKDSKRSPETIHIEMEAPPSGDYQQALDAVVAERMSDIAASVPEAWRTYMTDHFPGKQRAIDSALVISDDGVNHVGGSVMPPRALHRQTPSFSQAARAMRVSGITKIYLWVETDGTVDHLRIMRPVGMGLDEQALDAVSRYRFAPATQDGKPVTVDIAIEANFQILR